MIFKTQMTKKNNITMTGNKFNNFLFEFFIITIFLSKSLNHYTIY
jgi:hypothetical protein